MQHITHIKIVSAGIEGLNDWREVVVGWSAERRSLVVVVLIKRKELKAGLCILRITSVSRDSEDLGKDRTALRAHHAGIAVSAYS